ncbi:HAMP domain-containing sensor histidine kinase [Priestia megaterium]|uniref:sensor histidine kinase n=1 Tax=Priestia megaterium TaxID=1404 RepID=UPI002A69AB3F|nr:HAMP domain-containing sensor histidine kinase [Priestia megaterium]MDY0940655.1 HAMP domain-containing sensor histidine kinase [Priestia megaterium]
MGKIKKWMHRATLKAQFVLSFHLILLYSLLATLLTWGIVITVNWVLMPGALNPANYYEKQIPDILQFVKEKEDTLLSTRVEKQVESVIPLEGMDYQVINKEGQILYGSMATQYIKNKRDFYSQVNTNIHAGKYIIKVYPLFNSKDEVNGAIALRYQLNMASTNPNIKWIVALVTFLSLASPFLYFYLFAYLFGRRFSRRIERPFNELMTAAKNIQNNNLDFSLSMTQDAKELSQLLHAFEEMRKELKQSLSKQWQLEEDRKEMTAAIAHDLRTPLTIIHGHTEILVEGSKKDPERLNRYLHTIYTNTLRSIQLLNQLQEVSVIENPGFTVKREPIDINTFVHEKADELQLLCQKKEITFLSSVSESQAPIQFHGDPQRISQVLDNIITNCIRYTPERGEIVWNTVIHHKEIIFEIHDTGPGFALSNKEQLFKKFYREDTSRTGGHGNLGLGLYIAHSIVKNHGGSIMADNKDTGGAFIKVVLPMGEEVNS